MDFSGGGSDIHGASRLVLHFRYQASTTTRELTCFQSTVADKFILVITKMVRHLFRWWMSNEQTSLSRSLKEDTWQNPGQF